MPTLLEQIFAAGVVGAGGAGFPTHRKLVSHADTLIINAAECEPLLASDRYVMRAFAPEITEALLALRDEFGFRRIVIGTKSHYTDEISAMKRAFAAKNTEFEIFGMDSFYPAGDEQVMIYEITGKTVPPGGLPLEVGVIVQNVTTLLNIYDAIHGKPVTEKFVTVTGAVKRPSIVRAPVGASAADCIAAAGGVTGRAGFIIKGGPMMGRQYPYSQAKNLVIGKADGGIIVLPENHPFGLFSLKPITRILNQARSVCMQCSFCTEMCPRYLIGHKLRPNIVMRGMAAGKNPENLSEALLCSECGICENFACPMQLSPRRVNIYVKDLLRGKGIGIADKRIYPEQSGNREYRRISQGRIAGRLLPEGYPQEITETVTCEPESVRIPLKHGVGRPSSPVVSVGGKVAKGDVIAKVESADTGCLIHASVTGFVTKLDDHVTITREGYKC